MKEKIMKILAMIGLGMFLGTAFAADSAIPEAEHWAAPPKETTFKEFKYMATRNQPGQISTFEKQKTLYFKLTQKLQGDQTKICYGSTNVSAKTNAASGVACALSAVGAKTCVEVDFKKCSDDASLAPLKH